MMKKQAALGFRVSFVFLVLLIGIPLFNLYYPQLAATPVAGFTLTWLILGILFFPITWLLSIYFVRESEKIEAEAAAFAHEAGEPMIPTTVEPIETSTEEGR
jgi:uncharacterized membrane protein (DUF485 family)